MLTCMNVFCLYWEWWQDHKYVYVICSFLCIWMRLCLWWIIDDAICVEWTLGSLATKCAFCMNESGRDLIKNEVKNAHFWWRPSLSIRLMPPRSYGKPFGLNPKDPRCNQRWAQRIWVALWFEPKGTSVQPKVSPKILGSYWFWTRRIFGRTEALTEAPSLNCNY